MKSQGLFAAQYGRIEWRAKLPQGVGFWPALWLLGTNITSVGWPGCGEIDVMENVGSNSIMAQASIHSGSSSTAIYNFIDGEQTTNFNTYTMDWTTNAFLFYVNGHLYQTRTNWSSSAGSYPFPFNQPFFLIMNMAIGGTYIGNPTTNAINSGTMFPGEMLVDYVRISKVTEPFRIAIKESGTNIILSWPSNIACHLQAQTNGFGANWFFVSTTSNQIEVTPNNGSAFYRLVMP
jgi:beta-glucanase (GH16 family)